MSDPLVERLESLKKRLDDLAAPGTEQGQQDLQALDAKVARLKLALIVAELQQEDAAYASAMSELDQAIEMLDAAKDDMSAVASAIGVAAKGIAAVEKMLAVVR